MTDIRPYEPEYVVVADFYLKHPSASISSSSSESSTAAAALPLAPAAHLRLDTLTRHDDGEDREWAKPGGSVLLRSELGKNRSSVGVATNSTVEGSWSGRGTLEGGYAETLSDLDSGQYSFSSSDEADPDEPEPNPDVLAELLTQITPLDGQLQQAGAATSGQETWDNRQQTSFGDFARSSGPYSDDESTVEGKPDALLERIQALQSTVDQAYAMTQANEDIIRSLH
ncbi:hypothetical protein BBJ28_00012781 [Nothophytophthora sp. Chile5]|nr:hypothetical protein BBJ28_00012781 [Nothophytophthora sp. Chile5]